MDEQIPRFLREALVGWMDWFLLCSDCLRKADTLLMQDAHGFDFFAPCQDSIQKGCDFFLSL